MKRLALLLAMVAATPALADEPAYQSSPPRRTVVDNRDWGEWGNPFRAKLAPSVLQDFGERYLYAAANAALAPPAPGEQRVVFLGDSITDGWNLAATFPGAPYVNRGVGAQVTAQMLLRFEQDVVALRPSVVVILGGTNDLSGFLQVETPASIVQNITAMADIADANGIRLVIGSLLPVNNYGPNRDYLIRERPPEALRAVNRDLRALAQQRHYVFADYATPMTDAHGLLVSKLSGDGLHPNAAGYAVMASVAKAAVAMALAAPGRRVP